MDIKTAMELTGVDGKSTPLRRITKYVYIPTSRADKKIVKQGNAPDDLALLVNVLLREGYQTNYISWDYEDPKIWFEVVENYD